MAENRENPDEQKESQPDEQKESQPDEQKNQKSNDESSYLMDKQKNKKSDDENEYFEDESSVSSYLPVYRVKVKQYEWPIIISLIASGILAWFTYRVAGINDIIPQTSAASGFAYGVLFTIVAAISSVIIYIIVKKRGESALKYIMGFAFLVLTFLLPIFFGESILMVLNAPDIAYYILMGACGVLAVYLIYKFFSEKMSILLKNIFVLLIGILIGAFLGTIIPFWITLTLLMGVSIWDIISVKRGPIRKIMELTGGIDLDFEQKVKSGEIEEIDKESFNSSEIEIGVGDLAFYSMLTSNVLVTTGNLLYPIVGAVGIVVGSYLTISLLKKNKILPGLPLSIFIGVGLIALTYLIMFLIP